MGGFIVRQAKQDWQKTVQQKFQVILYLYEIPSYVLCAKSFGVVKNMCGQFIFKFPQYQLHKKYIDTIKSLVSASESCESEVASLLIIKIDFCHLYYCFVKVILTFLFLSA